MSDSHEDFAYVNNSKRKRLRWQVILLIVSLIVNILAASFAWWAIGLSVDAADTFSPAPPITHWIGTTIVTFLISSLLALFSAIMVIFNKNFSH